jgi:hypothetical protein
MTRFFLNGMLGVFAVALVCLSWPVQAATPSVEQALKLTPVQPGVDYDRPSPEDIP